METLLGRIETYHGGGLARLPLLTRMQHLYLLGKSGTGKSTLMLNLAIQDILAGQGIAVVDPHGDLVEELLHHIPRHRTRDVIYLNLSDFEHPIAWNPLERQAALPVATLTGHLLSACKHIWRDSWGPRMEYLLTNSLHALIEAGETLLSLPALLTDEAYRASISARIRDPKVRQYFDVEFAALDPRQRTEVISPVQNKIGQLLSHEAVRNILASRRSRLQLPHILDTKRILLVNLAKGLIGEEPANLFGSLLVSSIGAVALARSGLPAATRVPFFLYVDEFQNFSTDGFASMLSEVRKFNLGLVLANQFLMQLSEPVRRAVIGNVATRVFLAVGSEDAERLRLEIAPYPPRSLEELAPYTGFLKQSGGEAAPLALFAPLDTRRYKAWRTNRAVVIRSESRRRFAQSRKLACTRAEQQLRR